MSAYAWTGARSQFAKDVRAGLTKPAQKELPSRYLYDEVGTALFEAITLLPEYGLTRADDRLLKQHACSIVSRLEQPLVVTELGSGTGRKTRWVLEALDRERPLMYYAIDISGAALERCRTELSSVESLTILGLERSYLDGLREVAERREPGEKLLVLFLGSTIGNFDRPAAMEFLVGIRECLLPGDALLLGTDLVKPIPDLLAAYDDPAGVTAAFNLNLLARLNRELGATLDLRKFAHEARYDEQDRRIEMHLVSLRRQRADIPAAGLTVQFEEGETIWTESSHKFLLHEIQHMATRCGFRCDAQWIDGEWPFAENLWIAAPGT